MFSPPLITSTQQSTSLPFSTLLSRYGTRALTSAQHASRYPLQRLFLYSLVTPFALIAHPSVLPSYLSIRLQQLVVQYAGGVRIRVRPRWLAVSVVPRTPTSLASIQTTHRASRCQHTAPHCTTLHLCPAQLCTAQSVRSSIAESAQWCMRAQGTAAVSNFTDAFQLIACLLYSSGPTTVLVLSLAFIGSVVMLHIFGKLAK